VGVLLSNANFRSGSDELGVFAQVSVDPSVFSDTAIFKNAYWFTDTFYLFLSKSGASPLLTIEFRPKLESSDAPAALKAVCGEFWNALLDQEVRQHVLRETGNVRDTLVKKAFFDARASLPALPVAGAKMFQG
jgi:His-Xaa-Ser system protein HxsD